MKVIIITALIMLTIGATFALIWWRLADTIFPEASARTGKVIERKGRPRGPSGTVIRGFDSPPSPDEGKPPTARG